MSFLFHPLRSTWTSDGDAPTGGNVSQTTALTLKLNLRI